ncbi:hypothetical protein ABZ686_02320 [Streptomyces sp. NPDC006992]|uniref:hypothetical protein n=1 Tax=Streptomyces sp. NPDC006992 TaxID=3155601 RepID=UPI0033D588CC
MAEATTYEGRRQMDKVAARAAQAEAAAGARKADALTDLEIQNERAKFADQERRRKEAARTKRLEEKAKRKEKRAAARKARNERVGAALAEPLPWVMTVVITSIAFAFPGQFSAVWGLGVYWLLSLLVPVFIEGATWAMAWLRKWAVDNDKPATLYMVMTWLFAACAAALNGWHHWDEPQLAAVFAASSLFGVGVFEIYMHSQQHKAGGKSAEEIKLALQRRLRHPRVARRAAWLRSAAGMRPEQAWETAWRQIYGSAPGVTRRVLKRHSKQTKKVAEVVEEHDGLAADASLALFEAPPEAVREVPFDKRWAIDPEAISRILADPGYGVRAQGAQLSAQAPAKKIDKGAEQAREKPAQSPHTARTRAKSSQVAPSYPPPTQARQKGTEEGAGKQVRAARAAAAEKARAATPEKVEADRKTAREWALEQLRAGREIGWRDVREHFEQEVPEAERLVYGETWYRKQLTAAREELERPLHVVA